MNGMEIQKLIEVMESKNLSVAQVIDLINGQKTEKVIGTAFEMTFNVDYSKSIEQAITLGNYDWKDDGITAENFPISSEMIGKKVRVTTKLFSFNHNISSADAIDEMNEFGYRPATLMELLTLGFSFPELQRQSTIIALGSVWCANAYARSCVPCLSAIDSMHKLNLYFFDSNWGAGCLFIGVRK